MCLANRTYTVLEEALEDLGELAPSHGKREADRAVARVFGVAVSTARNWRRCQHQHVAHRTATQLIERCRDIAPSHVPRLEFLDHLAEGGQSLRTAAERLVKQMTAVAGGDWHLYDAPLTLAFSLDVPLEVRREWIERSSLLVARILDAGLDHTDVPALPELIRSSLHGWHHASRFDIRERSLDSTWSRAWLGYLSRVERALYFGDVRAMPALFSGSVAAADQHTSTARSLLDEVTDEDVRTSPVSVEDARIMIDAVSMQVWACHADRTATHDDAQRTVEDGRPEHLWIDSVRRGALGYAALRRGAFAEADIHLGAAAAHVDAWLRRSGLPFGSSPHLALSGYALLRSGGDPGYARSRAHEALHRSLEHGVIVDEIAARLCLAAILGADGGTSAGRYHAQRARDRSDAFGLTAWHDALGRMMV